MRLGSLERVATMCSDFAEGDVARADRASCQRRLPTASWTPLIWESSGTRSSRIYPGYNWSFKRCSIAMIYSRRVR